MNQKYTPLRYVINSIWQSSKRTSLHIRLFILLSACSISLSYATHAQNVKISIETQDKTVKEVLNEIEKLSGFSIFFNNKHININRHVSVSTSQNNIFSILDEVFKGTNVTYSVSDKMIILSVKQEGNNKIQVKGTVTDTEGNPFIGATVMEAGSKSNGVITDVDGNFSLQVGEGANLEISYIGYKTQRVKAIANRSIIIRLAEDSELLDEVVVVGYGTQRRRDLTGSVSSVNSNQLRDIPVTSAASAITGKMAGVQVTQTEGSPDAEIKIRVRGGGSLTQDNSPLYIVDGFPVDNINDIAPGDIASIDILKDASSTAIYGARGANGVIIVTTKSGSEGKAKVSYNMYYGMKKLNKEYDMLDPYEFVYWQYEVMNLKAGEAGQFEPRYGNFQDINLYKQMNGTDWQDEIFGNVGTTLYNNISVTGGSKTAKYNVSVSRTNEDDFMMGSGFDRTNLNSKTTFQIKKWLSLDLNIRLADTNIKGGGTSTNTRLPGIVQYRPINGLSDFRDNAYVDEDDDVIESSLISPVEQTNDDYRRTSRQTFNYNGALNINFMKGLTYRFEYGYQYAKNTTKRFYGLNTSNSRNTTGMPLATVNKVDGTSYRIANILTYSKNDFIKPDHNITVMLGEELNESKIEEMDIKVESLPKYIDAEGALSMLQLAANTNPITTFIKAPERTSSFFGRLNYDYKGRYMASAVFRADGSSKFAPGHQWGYFPSAAVAWRISDETFMQRTKNWLSDLKFRVSYGQSGNNRIPNDAWKKTFKVQSGNLFLEGNEETPTAWLEPESFLSNPDLKWETTITRNLGIDFSFFNHRLSGSVELYKNTTKDLLIATSIPGSSGYGKQYQNIGQTSNRGLELVLNAQLVQTKDFSLSASFNIAFNKNRIDKLGDTKLWEETSGWTGDSDGPSGDYLIKEGGKIGLMYGYETDGFYTFDDFNYTANADGKMEYQLKPGVANNNALVGHRVFGPGALKFVNQNPEEDNIVNEDDKVVIGDANPLHTGGFSLTAQYKSFDLSAFFNWVYGNDIYNANKLAFNDNRSGRLHKNISSTMSTKNRFIYHDLTTGERVQDPEQLKALNEHATIWSPAHSLCRLHSWAVEDGSFLRLNNLTIGYSLPKRWLSKVGIEQFRVYATGYNLWTWTSYSGYDPEVDAIRKTPLTPGIDYSAYPRSRSYVFGLNLTF